MILGALSARAPCSLTSCRITTTRRTRITTIAAGGTVEDEFHLVKQQHQGKALYDEVLGSVVPFSLAIFFSVTVLYPYSFCKATVHSCVRITILIYH
jgi:hypothetical protein